MKFSYTPDRHLIYGKDLKNLFPRKKGNKKLFDEYVYFITALNHEMTIRRCYCHVIADFVDCGLFDGSLWSTGVNLKNGDTKFVAAGKVMGRLFLPYLAKLSYSINTSKEKLPIGLSSNIGDVDYFDDELYCNVNVRDEDSVRNLFDLIGFDIKFYGALDFEITKKY